MKFVERVKSRNERCSSIFKVAVDFKSKIWGYMIMNSRPRESTVLFSIIVLFLIGSMSIEVTGKVESAETDADNESLLPITLSQQLQKDLELTVTELLKNDDALKSRNFQVAIIDLRDPAKPREAHIRGELPVYPASVIKFVYLMAAYHWKDEGKITMTPEWMRHLTDMIRHSDNQATRWVFYHLTDTEAGAELGPDDYAIFREKRLAVKKWLATLGVTDIHCIHPTFDGNGDLMGRDVQILRDRSFTGALPAPSGSFGNRLAMTALGTARLLSMLATGKALPPTSTDAVLKMMKRDVNEQPYLARRIAGGALRNPDLEVYSKTGTFRETFADAGIIRDTRTPTRQFVLVVFIQDPKGYKGTFIADLADRFSQLLLQDQSRPVQE